MALEIRFDDVASLQARVGEPFSPYGEPVYVTQDAIQRFADVTGDHQWIHVDVERARRESPLKTPIAHGFLILSLLPTLRLRADLRIVGHGSALNYGADKLRFLSPVPSGAAVRARARIVQIEPKARGVLVTEEIEVAIAGREAEKPALVYTMLVLYLPPTP